jgi:phage terminase large subunit-like protein
MFCAESAERAVHFIERHCRWPEGDVAGQLIVLEPWQREIVEKIFGTLKDDGSGHRQYRKAGVFVPRKNSKSAGLAAPIGLKLLFADGEYGAQIYSCARDREQAAITYRMAKTMVQLDPALRRRAHIVDSKRLIAFPRMNSFWRALPREGMAAQGYNPYGVIFDELHTQPDERMYEAMDLGSGTRSQPLFLWTSTAGEDPAELCRREVSYATQVAQGVIDDPTYFAFLRQIKPGEDWKDENVWRRVNPASFRSIDDLRAKFKRALVEKRKELAFRMYYLNEFVDDATVGWLSLEAWDASAGDVDELALRGRPCWLGLDLSSTTDLTAYCLAFPMEDGTVKLVLRFFLPREGLFDRSESDRASYHAWADAGLITLIEGNCIDYEVVQKSIEDDGARFDIREIAFDPYQALSLVTTLTNSGFKCVQHRQGTVSMSSPMKECERLILAKKLHHGSNPVQRWMFTNTAVKEDSGDSIKPIKRHSKARKDGIDAMIMSVGKALIGSQEEESVYARGKGLVLG